MNFPPHFYVIFITFVFIDMESEQQDLVNGDTQTSPADREEVTRKSRRKRWEWKEKTKAHLIFDFPVMNRIQFLSKRQNEWTENEMHVVSFYCAAFLIESYSLCRKSKITENQHNTSVVEDDNVVTDAHTSISHRSLFSAPLGHSQSLSKVFVERNREFFIH